MTDTASAATDTQFIVLHHVLTVGGQLMGGITLKLDLISYGWWDPFHYVRGVAHLTQPISPPLDVTFDVAGTISKDAGGNLIHLQGQGQPPVSQFTAILQINSPWTEGTASVTYKLNNQWVTLHNLPVKGELLTSSTTQQ